LLDQQTIVIGADIFSVAERIYPKNLSIISAAYEIDGLAPESADDLGWTFINRLRHSGHDAAKGWLLSHFSQTSPKFKMQSFE
jgi:hypothetical protein